MKSGIVRAAAAAVVAGLLAAVSLAASAADGTLDHKAPVLSAFQASAQVTAGKPGAQVDLAMSLRDKLSGLRWVRVRLVGPSGQEKSVYADVSYPRKDWFPTMSWVPDAFTEPGEWRVDAFYASDFNGNSLACGEAELAALGNTRIQVANSLYDAQMPVLQSATVLTPLVSKSQAPRGMAAGTPAFAGVRVRLTDSGQALSSGVFSVEVTYCLMGSGGCKGVLSLRGLAPPGIHKAVVIDAGNPMEGTFPNGIYRLQWVALYDRAGNGRRWTSTEFGGETDFSTVFSSTTMEIRH